MKKTNYIVILTVFVFFVSCNPDPCDATNCLNGGYCESGTCNCPPGYVGKNCEIVLTPKSMTISEVIINSFPDQKNIPGVYGSFPWDNEPGLESRPDLYLTINKGTSPDFTDVITSIKPNTSSREQPGFIVNKKINSLYDNWSIGLWDRDGAFSREFIGRNYFKPSEYIIGFPDRINLYNSTQSEIKYILKVHWNF